MASSIQNNLLRDRLTTVVLKSLNDSDRPCQDIARDLEQRSSGQFKIKTPTLNSCLLKLEKEGLVTSYTRTNNKKTERVYSITDIGKQNYIRSLTEWEYNRSIADKLLSEKSLNLSILPPLAPPPRAKRHRHNTNAPKTNDNALQQMQELLQTSYMSGRMPTINTRYQPSWVIQQDPNNAIQTQTGVDTHTKDPQLSQQVVYDTTIETQIIADNTVESDDNSTPIEHSQNIAQQIIAKAIQDSLSNQLTQPTTVSDTIKPLQHGTTNNTSPYQADNDLSQSLQISHDNLATNFDTTNLHVYKSPTTTETNAHDSPTKINQGVQLDNIDNDNVATLEYKSYNDTVEYPTKIVSSQNLDVESQDVSSHVVKLAEEIIQQSIDNTITIDPSDNIECDDAKAEDTTTQFEYNSQPVVDERKTIIEREYRQLLADLIVDVEYNQDNQYIIYNQQAYDQYTPDSAVDESPKYHDTNSQINIDDNNYSTFDESTNQNSQVAYHSNANSQQLDQLKYSNLVSSVQQLNKGIVVRPHNKLVTKDYKYNNYYYCNKLMDRQFSILFLIMLAEIVTSFVLLNIVFGSNQERSYLYYIGALVVTGSLPIYAAMSKHYKPNKRKRYIGSFKVSMIFRLALFTQISALAVFFSIMLGLSLNIFKPYIVSLIIPIVVASNIPLSGLIFNNLFVSRKYAITE